MYLIYKEEVNSKYQYEKAIFLKEYGKFLNGLAFFSSLGE
jgi:hypothetical protein